MALNKDLVKYFKVRWTGLASVIDGADPDDNPDLAFLEGTVTFTPNLPFGASIKFQQIGEPYSIVPIKRKIQVIGGVFNDQSRPYIKLESPTMPFANPQSWNWKVDFDLYYNQVPVPLLSFNFTGDPDDDLDLTNLSPGQDPLTGIWTAVGPPGTGIKRVEITGNQMVVVMDDEFETHLPPVIIPAVDDANAAAAAALASQVIASQQATIATTKAGEANTSAGTASTQAGIATTKAGEASTSATTATTQAGIATTKAGEANTSAGTATAQAGIATTKAGEASGSAGNAYTSAGLAAGSAGTASTKAGQATQALADVQALQVAIQASLDAYGINFQDWMGRAETAAQAAEQALADANAMIIPNNAVTEPKIADNAVTTTKIASGAVTSDKIADGTIATADLADLAVTGGKIADSTIPGSKLSNLAVTAGKIANKTVTGAQIADGTITSTQIAPAGVSSANLNSKIVTAGKIADNTITAGQIAPDTITAAQIAPDAITASELADGAVDTTAILDANVTLAKLATSAKATGFNYGIWFDTRKVGLGDGLAPMGFTFPVAFKVTKITLKMGTADGTGTTTVMPKKNTTNFANSISINAGSLTNSSTYNQDFAIGDDLTFDTTLIGGTPGKQLKALVEGYPL